jgi:RimJ/RimL family protein N-acetyltransferase
MSIASDDHGTMANVREIAVAGELAIRRMRDDPSDYELIVRWRNEPHVREWWDPDDPPMTLAAAIEEYRADTRGGSPTTACIIEQNGSPIGFLQFYRWSDEPSDAEVLGISLDQDAWGLDLFIGEPSQVGRGVGPRVIDLLCRFLFDERGASLVALVAAQDNARALRAYERSGFRRVQAVLDTDVKGGRRVWSWLLVRDVPA